MTVKIIEEIHCDRCGQIFDKKGQTMEIGWFKFTNGSGSKRSSNNRSHDNLDQDLCNDCTESFEAWWESKL